METGSAFGNRHGSDQMDHSSVVAELGPLTSHIVKPWLWTGCMTKPSHGRRQTTNWSDDSVALYKRGSLLIRCPATHACMCDRGLDREMIWRAPHTGLPERGDPVLPVGQGAVQATAQADRRDGG